MVVTVEQIRDAVVRQEGEPVIALNPGNLRGAPWIVNPVIVKNMWVPVSRLQGIAGIDHLIALHRAQGNTLTDFIAGHPGVYAGFAPIADGNDPAIYIANIMLWTGIPDATVPLWDYIV